MALTNSEKREIEGLIKKEIKNFLGSNTAKQFEDNLQLNYQRYEKRIIHTRVNYEKKLESVKQAAAYFIEAQNLALNSAKLNNRLLEERCEMRVNEYESALIG